MALQAAHELHRRDAARGPQCLLADAERALRLLLLLAQPVDELLHLGH